MPGRAMRAGCQAFRIINKLIEEIVLKRTIPKKEDLLKSVVAF
jgi:hypothetical protein